MSGLPKLGDTFADRFRIEMQLGEGGFGMVYSAADQVTNQHVALKVLKNEGVDDPTLRTRFVREVEIVGQLKSAHTVRLHSHGMSSGFLWAAFELLPGQDLAKHLEGGRRFSAAEARHVLTQILHALREAHTRGLIHRDLKPDNIRVFDGSLGPLTVKVLDFGIARSTEQGGPSVTATGELIGTLRYMSPEQLHGKPLTPASDVYSAGLLAYEMIAGSDALGGNSLMEQIGRLAPDHQFVSPSQDPETEELMQVLRAMLSNDPTQRLKSAGAALEALKAQVDDTTIVGSRPADLPTVPRAPLEEPESRMHLVALAIASLLFCVVAGYLVFKPIPASAPGPAVDAAGERRKNPFAERAAKREDVAAKPKSATAKPKPAPAKLQPQEPATECETAATNGGTGLFPGHLFVPETFDANNAAILVLLKEGSNKISERAFFEYLGVEDLARRENLVVFTPPSIFKVRPQWRDEVIDAAWTSLEHLRTRYCLDSAPIFLIGEGTGARVVEVLAERHGPEIAAVVTTTGRYQRGKPGLRDILKTSKFQPIVSGSAPRLDVAPLEDIWIPYDGGMNVDERDEYYSAGQRWERLESDHRCHGEPRRVSDVEHEDCVEKKCSMPLQTCTADSRYWSRAPWRPDEPVAKFPYLKMAWRFLERFRDKGDEK